MRIAKDRSDLLVIEAPPEAKDPCELAQELGVVFPSRMRELIDKAEVRVSQGDRELIRQETQPIKDLPQLRNLGLFAQLRRADLADYTARFTSLTQMRPDCWKGTCPIDNEKSATFYVYRGQNGWWWRCYGAYAAWGDIVTLKQELRRVGKD
jgi:hypothetical protein